MFDRGTIIATKDVLDMARQKGFTIATAESCTGGMVAAALTSVAGSSTVFERGFVTYSNQAKADMLGIDPELIETHGAVSEQVARSMCEGAIQNSAANLAVSITGIAGPGGGTVQKPVGTVHIAGASLHGVTKHIRLDFGDLDRDEIRHRSLLAAYVMLKTQMKETTRLA